MTLVDTLIIIGIISFLILLVWSKIEKKTIKEVLLDIKELFTLKE